ncbi:MAG: ATP-binding protein [Lachnospiraceae bacterium]|nr:ATP-binding protein [Lachnospiraceae bacterium]
MLLQFKFANYRSFADETVFDMTATPIREHKKSLIEKNGVNVLPVAAFYGANASGKSSFFQAFYAMCDIIRNEKKIDKKNILGANTIPFAFYPAYAEKPTEFEVCFVLNDFEYRYGFEHTAEKIICEYLYKKKFSKNKTVEKIIYERIGNKVKSDASLKLKAEIDYCASMCVEHSLLLSDLGKRKKIDEFAKVYGMLDCPYPEYLVRLTDIESILNGLANLASNEDKFISILTKKMMNLITEIDEGIISIKSIKNETGKGYTLKSVHKIGEDEIEVPISIESDGTKQLFALSFCFLGAILTGSYCFIDELDLRLHPLLLRKIVHMFKNKKINKNGAQLIFSAHNIINLDYSDLRRDEIWFVEKNNHKSSIFSLYDYEDDDGGDIRADLDFGKHYLLGRFGAIPFQKKDE